MFNFIGKYNGYLLFYVVNIKIKSIFLFTFCELRQKCAFFVPTMEVQKQNLTPNQALQKLKHYCAYQERCHKEVKDKLYTYGLYTNDVDMCISTLIEENYLNEERFAIAYAGGKFRIKKWGRVKIKYSLKQKQVSEYCIKKALLQLDDDVYMENLQKLATKKWESLKGEKNIYIKKRKLKDCLQLQGYELDLIAQQIKEMQNE